MMKEGNCIVNHEETNILFVEDDATICKSLPPILETYGYKVKNVNTYMQAIQTIKADNFDLYLIDIHIPGGDGFELCRMIRKQGAVTTKKSHNAKEMGQFSMKFPFSMKLPFYRTILSKIKDTTT